MDNEINIQVSGWNTYGLSFFGMYKQRIFFSGELHFGQQWGALNILSVFIMFPQPPYVNAVCWINKAPLAAALGG